MKTNINILLAIFFLTITPYAKAAKTKPMDSISMTLPESLVSEAASKSMPMVFPLKTGTVLGTISVDAIENMQIHKGKVSGKVTLSGNDLKLVTSIAGHNLRMKIGSLMMQFQCDTTIRFDKKSQTIFLKPTITELQSSDRARTEAASAITMLFNNREFPLHLNRIKPVTADTGTNILNVSTIINAISLKEDTIHLRLIPKIAVISKK